MTEGDGDDEVAFADAAPGYATGRGTPDPAKVASRDGEDDLIFSDEVGKPGERLPKAPPAPPAPAPILPAAPPAAAGSGRAPRSISERTRADAVLEPPNRAGKLARASSGALEPVGGARVRAKRDEVQHELVKPGAVLGEWTVGATLGEEDGVRLFKAERNGREAILREHPLAPVQAAELVARAERLAPVNNDQLEPLLGWGRSRAGAWYVVEPRTSLERGIRAARAPLNEREALAVVRSAAHALAALNARSLVHGEPSPRNVLLDATGAVRLGSPVRAVRAGQAPLLAGPFAADVRYAAPEVLDGQPPTVASDVHALGLLFAFLVTGSEPPSEDEVVAAIVARARAGPPELPGASSAGARAIYARLTAPDPGQRPSPAEVAQLVDAFLERGAVAGAPPPRPPIRVESAPVPKAVAFALATIAVLALVAMAALAIQTEVLDPTEGYGFRVSTDGR